MKQSEYLCDSCRHHRLEINNEKTIGEFLDDATSPDGSLFEAKWLLANMEKEHVGCTNCHAHLRKVISSFL